MKNVGFIGWRGMVGSVLMDRMSQENDFANLNPVFFTTSLILFLGFYQGAYRAFLIEMLILYIVIFTLMFILIYVQKVNKIRKTFLKAVKKGYPELYNEYEDKLYEYVD